MLKSVVLSVLGDDTPGLVGALSRLVVMHQGQWVESRMANLAGKFAGIVRITLPESELAAFTHTVEQSKFGLNVMVQTVGESQGAAAATYYKIELIGQDQPGIIHKLSSALTHIDASVDELTSEVVEASMSGESLFKASLIFHVNHAVTLGQLEDLLADIEEELTVDIDLIEVIKPNQK